MTDYIKGLITGYDRILNQIEQLDPENKNNLLGILKEYILICSQTYKDELLTQDKLRLVSQGYREYLEKLKADTEI